VSCCGVLASYIVYRYDVVVATLLWARQGIVAYEDRFLYSYHGLQVILPVLSGFLGVRVQSYVLQPAQALPVCVVNYAPASIPAFKHCTVLNLDVCFLNGDSG